MEPIPVCQHFKYGYCRYLEKYKNKHESTICQEKDCVVSLCRKRHPKKCRYFEQYSRCKFGSFCHYLHEPSLANTILLSFETKIAALESVIDKVEKENVDLKSKIKSIEGKMFLFERHYETEKTETIIGNTTIEAFDDSAIADADLTLGNICSTTSTTLTLLSSLWQPLPPDKRAYLEEQGCDLCDTEFTSTEEIILHMETANTRDICEDCRKFYEPQSWFPKEQVCLPTRF